MRVQRIAIVLMWWMLSESAIVDAHASEYRLAMSQEKAVCHAMLKFANQGLLETAQLERPETFEAPGFESVKWSTIPHADSFQAMMATPKEHFLTSIMMVNWIGSSEYSGPAGVV